MAMNLETCELLSVDIDVSSCASRDVDSVASPEGNGKRLWLPRFDEWTRLVNKYERSWKKLRMLVRDQVLGFHLSQGTLTRSDAPAIVCGQHTATNSSQ